MTESAVRSYYRKCATCRGPLSFSADYYRCSVSTCNKKRAPLCFCSVPCWDAHQAEARHRDAWAEQARAPSRSEFEAEQRASAPGAERPSTPVGRGARGRGAHEVLVVMSRFKDYVKRQSGLAVSDRTAGALSDEVRSVVDAAARSAANDGRKTVLDRDVRPLVSRRSAALGTEERDDEPEVILIVTSKLKAYVRQSSSMNTSDGVLPVLSGHLRYLARQAARHALQDDRRTLFDRDVTAVVARS